MSTLKISTLILVLILTAALTGCDLRISLLEEQADAIGAEEIEKETLLVKDDDAALVEEQDIQPIELQQIILADGHPEFPVDTVWVVVPGEPTYFEVPIPLAIPASWAGKFTIDHIGNTARYLYTGDPNAQETIFSITAMPEAEWQTIQDEPHGEALLSYGGFVWVYNPALESFYTGEHAETFSRMVGEAFDVSHSLVAYFTPVINADNTLPTLQAYFDSLRAGNYLEAAQLFGGDYTQLIEYNPGVSPDDGAALFEAACQVNGFVCNLNIGEILETELVSDQAVQFTLILENPDGSHFEIGPCCEDDLSISEPQAEFDYTVAWQDGSFRVITLPVYAP